MDRAAVLQFLAVDLLLVLTPGADWAYAIRAGLRGERIAAAVGGLAGGYALHGVLVAVGVGALLARDAGALGTLTFVGALYLVWLGVSTLRERGALSGDDDGRSTRAASAVALRGALISGLNPKGLLLFFAVLPQFVRPQAPWPIAAQLAALGALHVLACAVVYAIVGCTARSVLRERQRAATVVGLASGLLMTAIGVVLAIRQAMHL